MGIFKLPTHVRPQSSQSNQRFFREVQTETMLREAIAAFASTRAPGAADYSFIARGGEIVIAAPFKSAQIQIPAQCVGLTIRSYGYVPIAPSEMMDSLFIVGAVGVTLVGLLCLPKTTTAFARSLVTISDDAFAGDDLTIERCLMVGERIFVDAGAGAGATNVHVINNKLEDISGTGECPVAFDTGGSGFVFGNELASNGALEAVRLLGGGGPLRITGNECNGCDIDTSGGGGHCTIIGNTNVGVSVAAPTDAVGLNT